MNTEKYNREIPMNCPTCGRTQFKTEENESASMVECASCGRQISKDDLLRENSENINAHVSEASKQVTDALLKDFKASLKKLGFK